MKIFFEFNYKHHSIATLLMLLCLLAGCSDWPVSGPIEYDYQPSMAPVLVLNARLSSQDTAELYLGRTVALDDTSDYPFYVLNATVLLYENGSLLIDTLRYTNYGRYISTIGFKPLAGRAYHYEVAAPGFATAYSVPDTVMLPIDVESIFWDTLTQRIDIRIKDDPLKENYYDFWARGNIDWEYLQQQKNKTCYNSWYDLYEDKCFGTEPIIFRVQIGTDISTLISDSIIVDLYSFDPDYVNYREQAWQQDGDEYGIVINTSNLPTNVINGLGLVYTMNRTRQAIPIK